ncbi:MAG TPA: hypothetical protein EYG68_08225 [Leucothrix mucor]|nr:hypothetical protein [Leucothrix mucor]
MKIFNNIIVSVDFKTEDEKAKIDHAIAIAEENEAATFTLFTVTAKVTFDPEKSVLSEEKQQEVLFKRATEQLERIAEGFPTANKVACLVAEGTPSVEIVKQVLRGEHDLLLTSTRKEKTAKEHILGSTMVELMRQCPCPVWAVKPAADEERKIMVGMHFDEEVVDHNDTLNHRLLNIATSLKDKSTQEIHLINIVKKANDEVTAERLGELKKLATDVPSETSEMIPVVLEGNVTAVISQYVEQQSIDLLIMGMLSRTGILGFFIGNTAEKIMDDLDCSILVVKPKEFVSQISI